MASNPYTRYHYNTDELVSRFKPSLSNTFDVSIRTPPLAFGPSGYVSWDELHFMAYEAVLPGTSYELGQVYGDRQGRTEQYPTKRVYPPVDVSFYIDQDYKAIRFFEAWINSMTTNKGTNSDSYVVHNYANSYEGEVTITKYERNTRPNGSRLRERTKSVPIFGNVIKYTLRNAFPSNLISIPVSYNGADVLRTTVTFNYDVYFFELKSGVENASDITGVASGDQIDSLPTSQSTSNPEQRASWRYTEEELERFRGNAAIESISRSPKAKQILSGTAISGTANRIGAESLSRSEGSPPLPPTN